MKSADPFAPSKKLLGYTTQTIEKTNELQLEIPKDFVKFNELIGNPIHPATQEQMPLTPYQLDFFTCINTSSLHKYHLNKARQMGFTELVIRILLFYALTKYSAGKIVIMAGTRLDTTKDIFQRLSTLIKNLAPYVQSSGPIQLCLQMVLR